MAVLLTEVILCLTEIRMGYPLKMVLLTSVQNLIYLELILKENKINKLQIIIYTYSLSFYVLKSINQRTVEMSQCLITIAALV